MGKTFCEGGSKLSLPSKFFCKCVRDGVNFLSELYLLWVVLSVGAGEVKGKLSTCTKLYMRVVASVRAQRLFLLFLSVVEFLFASTFSGRYFPWLIFCV